MCKQFKKPHSELDIYKKTKQSSEFLPFPFFTCQTKTSTKTKEIYALTYMKWQYELLLVLLEQQQQQ